MKKKAFFDSIGIPSIIFAAALVIALPLRTLQYFKITEGATGFYSEKDITVWVLYAVIILAVAALIAFSFGKRKDYVLDTKPAKRPGCGILAAMLGIFCLFDAMTCFNYTLDLGLDFILMPQFPNQLPITEKIISLEAVFALISAVYFVLCAICFITGSSSGEKLRLLALTPVVWNVLRIVYRFSITISYLRVAQLTLEMFMLIFFVLYFMTYAQVNSGVNGAGLDWKIVAYGLAASFFALLCFVPQFIVVLAGRQDLLYMYSVPCYCDFAAALLIAATVLTRIGIKESAETEEPEKEEN